MNIDSSMLTAMPTGDLDQLIAQAISERGRREDSFPAEPTGEAIAYRNPAWIVEPHGGGTLLHILHVGLGWQTWLFDGDDRANLLLTLLGKTLEAGQCGLG